MTQCGMTQRGMTQRKTIRRQAACLALVLVSLGPTLPALAQSDPAKASEPTVQEDSGEVQAPANASQVDKDAIDKSGGVGRDNAGFTDGGAQTPVDQRPNALSFEQLDVDGDGVIDEQEATSADQANLYRQLRDEEAGGVTREGFEQALGSDTLTR